MPGLRPGRPRPTPRFTLLGSVWERRMNAYKLHHTLPSKKDHSPNYCSELPCGSKAWQEVMLRQLCLLLIKKVKCSHVKDKLNPKSRKRALKWKTGTASWTGSVSKPDRNVELTLNAGPVLHVLEDVDWLLAVAVDVDWTPVHLRERLTEIKDQWTIYVIQLICRTVAVWDLTRGCIHALYALHIAHQL